MKKEKERERKKEKEKERERKKEKEREGERKREVMMMEEDGTNGIHDSLMTSKQNGSITCSTFPQLFLFLSHSFFFFNIFLSLPVSTLFKTQKSRLFNVWKFNLISMTSKKNHDHEIKFPSITFSFFFFCFVLSLFLSFLFLSLFLVLSFFLFHHSYHHSPSLW